MNKNDEKILESAAMKRGDASFEAAPRAGSVLTRSWIAWAIIAVVVVLGLAGAATRMPPGWHRVAVIGTDALILAVTAAAWFASSIRAIAIEGRTLLIKLTFWTVRFDLAGLRSVCADADAFRGSLRTFGNGGLGAFHGYFYSKRMGKFRGYVSDTAHSVVLRWDKQCVVVSPKDTGYFIEEVCKRTGVRRQD